MSDARPIFVSGLPGAGKSTLSTALAQRLNYPIVRFDDYERLTRQSPGALSAWLASGCPLDAALAPGFAEAVLAHPGPAIVDGPFGQTWPGLTGLGGLSIWLDCPLDIALARKLQTLAAAGARDPGFADWMAGWLGHYPGFTRSSYVLIRDRVQSSANLIIDAKLPTNIHINQVVEAITAT